MNNRYLYRAKRVDDGEWIIWNIFTGIPHDIIISEETICQCTGRNDEWEHDVLWRDDERYEIQFCEQSLTWEAVSIFSSESIELGEFSPSEYVRLGNSIDNPELLEAGG